MKEGENAANDRGLDAVPVSYAGFIVGFEIFIGHLEQIQNKLRRDKARPGLSGCVAVGGQK